MPYSPISTKQTRAEFFLAYVSFPTLMTFLFSSGDDEIHQVGVGVGKLVRGTADDENENSLYNITTCSNIQVMRIKEVITKDKMF